MSPSKFFAVIAGAGTGTGRACALRFAKTYPVLLLARRPETYQDTVSEINKAGGQALGVPTDAADPTSVQAALDAARREFGADSQVAAAIYNVASGFVRKPFLELSVQDLDSSFEGSARGLFVFAQKTIPSLLESVGSSPSPPTLIATGATASLKGSANFSTLAAGMFARRAVAQSLAREFGPQGVHVAHAVIDGIIDIPRTQAYAANGGVEGGKLDPDAIAESYWHLHTQPRSAWTQELDMRPFVEKF